MLGDSVFCVTTAADGTFVLRAPPLGDGRVFVAAAGYEPSWRQWQVQTDAPPLELAIDALFDVAVTWSGRPSPGLVGVRATRRQPGSSSDYYTALSGLATFAEDGTLRLRDIAPAHHWFELVVACAPRQGSPQKLVVHEADVVAGMPKLELDARAVGPARVRGRVTGPVPLQRLAVLSSPLRKDRQNGHGYLQYRGPLCPLDVDGSYDIRELPGQRHVLVIDLQTGVVFARAAVAEVAAGDDRTLDFTVAAEPVRVTVRRAAEAGQPGFLFVEVLPSPELWPADVGQIVGHDGTIERYCRGMGAVVPASDDHVDLWLPPGTFQLALRTYSANNAARAGEPHGPVVTLAVKPDHENAATVGW